MAVLGLMVSLSGLTLWEQNRWRVAKRCKFEIQRNGNTCNGCMIRNDAGSCR